MLLSMSVKMKSVLIIKIVVLKHVLINISVNWWGVPLRVKLSVA